MTKYRTNKAAKEAFDNGEYYNEISKLWNSDGLPAPTWEVAMEYKKYGYTPSAALADRNRRDDY